MFDTLRERLELINEWHTMYGTLLIKDSAGEFHGRNHRYIPL
jgi:hypothetical protein